MRFTELVQIGVEYLKLGLIVGVVCTLLFMTGYFILYRKIGRGKKKLSFAKLLWWGILIVYLIVVFGVTFFLRGENFGNSRIRPLFYSYRDAWVHWSAAAWRNILLNFCLLIPFGFWMPVGFKSFRKFRKASLAGFVFTLLIETMQLITRRGIFELDDILGNTVGTMIGYGLFVFGNFVYVKGGLRKKEGMDVTKENPRLIPVLTAQLPLVLTILCFGLIFGRYERQELGNNPYCYVEAADRDMITVSGESDFDETENTLWVYQVQMLSVQEAKEKGEQIFRNLGTKIDESRTIVYDDTLVLYSEKSRYSLWIDFKGGTYRLTDFQVRYPESGDTGGAAAGVDEETIRAALEKTGILVPAGAEFEELGSGNYQFMAKMIRTGTITEKIDAAEMKKTEEILYNGALTCRYFGEAGIGEVRNEIISCMPYKEFPAISAKDAYNKIADGEFLCAHGVKLEIQVKSCTISYGMDSKGYYQPNFGFLCVINGEESTIFIPALNRTGPSRKY